LGGAGGVTEFVFEGSLGLAVIVTPAVALLAVHHGESQ